MRARVRNQPHRTLILPKQHSTVSIYDLANYAWVPARHVVKEKPKREEGREREMQLEVGRNLLTTTSPPPRERSVFLPNVPSA